MVRVEGSGLDDDGEDSGFRVQGSGFKVLNMSRIRMSQPPGVSGCEFEISGFGPASGV